MNQTTNKIKGVIQLSDVKNCIGTGNYYHQFRGAIANIKNVEGGENMLFALRRDYERYMRAYPQEDEEIEKTYRLLKKKCLLVMAECD